MLTAVITAYQKYGRALFPQCCRYWPSCSEYAKQALQRYGLIKGGYKAVCRLMRCHPYSGRSGFDPLT